MDKKLIVIVDDEHAIVNMVTEYLTDEGFKVKGFLEGHSLFNFLETKKPDLIILDLMLPEMDGFEICRLLKVKEELSTIPIIILSGRDEETNKVLGLEIGADDYIVKPFSLKEMGARIKAVLRRLEPEEKPKVINISDLLVIDQQKYQVTAEGKKVALTPTEFKILELLCSRKGQVFTRDRILDYLWGEEKVVITRTIDVHIRHLREKLGKTSKLIKNVRGIGYKVDDEE
ncbi:MAG: response regulator transcription factor [Candidatus Omnitrophota bacterium]|nr:response regulator transcription factor [Candidatus Omnitrophota bacterium]